MKIGFIGAGKVGTALGDYFHKKGLSLSGYASRSLQSAKEAAQFTNSIFYSTYEALIADSDIIFLTVSDGAISSVWNLIKEIPMQDKIFCHCSGSISSQVFSDIHTKGAFGYSIHPLLAIHSKEHSYNNLTHAIFTIEGDQMHLDTFMHLLKGLGNPVQNIPTDTKPLYHAAAVFASNHVVALAKVSMDLLMNCGFDESSALSAITPLLMGNVSNITKEGPTLALTGPIERNDTSTIQKHLDCLKDSYQLLYRELSKVLIEIGKEKHPELNYEKMLQLLL
ncbi:MAG: DUF2520 domain-containing protein [Lachnospiraceae bacterium]|nr:DUF2520 domain-containing protein [Lachnospiraceae bacterium]